MDLTNATLYCYHGVSLNLTVRFGKTGDPCRILALHYNLRETSQMSLMLVVH